MEIAGIGGNIDRMADLQAQAETIPGSGDTSTIVWLGYLIGASYERWKGYLTPVGLGILVLLVLAAVFAPVLAPYSPIEPHYEDALQGPGHCAGLIWSGVSVVTSDTLSTTMPMMRPPMFRMITTVNWS